MVGANTWKKESGFVWSMIGSAVGFANVLSFSALCYKNGGGAFLIPYVIAHLIIGLPLLFLEGVIGQKNHLPLVSAMGRAGGRGGRALGWIATLSCAVIGGFYIVLTGFAVVYIYFTATGVIGADTAHFFKHIFLQDTGSISDCGSLVGWILIGTLSVIAFAWAVLMRNIQSGIERLCSVFLPLLGILIVCFTLASFFLPGASLGVRAYLLPKFATLKSPLLWRDVFGQVFFSLSLGLGIVTGYARHNPHTFSIKRAMVRVAIGDFLISFVAGLAIFGCIGFMSAKTHTPFDQLVSSDSAFEIGFVIFPMILSQFGALTARLIGPLFFSCVFIAGVTGVFSIVESVAGNFEVEFHKSRKQAVAIAMCLVSCLALPFCMGNGQHLIGAMAPMVLGNVLLVGGISEIVLFLFLSKEIKNDPIWFHKSKQRSYSFYCLKYVVLTLLILSLCGALYKEFAGEFTLAFAMRYIWLAIVLSAAFLLSKKRVSKAFG